MSRETDSKDWWLSLSLSINNRPATLRLAGELCDHNWRTLPEAMANADTGHKALQEPLTAQQKKRLQQALAWEAGAPDRHILHPRMPTYPAFLLQLTTPPLVLFVEGAPELLASWQLAVVGSRHPSVGGSKHTSAFSEALCQNGWTITSGMARGVDGLAHAAALKAGGNTIAVLGSGIDVIYPKRHAKLRAEILAAGGCIVSEFFPGTPPLAHHFPQRNRIISGLSRGVLVVEAAQKSGSLITARYALEQGREVFAVPGSLFNPMSAGCHMLIQHGAKLVTAVEDINEEFYPLIRSEYEQSVKKAVKKGPGRLASDRLLDSVDYEVTSVDEVAIRSELPVSEVTARLIEYELRGLVASVPGGYVKLGGNSYV